MKQHSKLVKIFILLVLFCFYISVFSSDANNAFRDETSGYPVLSSDVDDTSRNEASDHSIAANIPADFRYAFEGIDHISLQKQPSNRYIIDDVLEPSLWKGTEGSAQVSGAVSLSSTGNTAEAYRKYDSLLSLQTYLFLNVEAVDHQNLEWAALYLMEDLNYSNYYECDIIPYLSEGSNVFALNKNDFAIGSGIPSWDKISIIKIALSSFDNSAATITLREISTYGAHPVCSIWFDDGWETVYTEAFPIMEERKFKGILSVIGSHVGYESYCSDVELDALYGCGWDLVNHTYYHTDLTSIAPEEAEADIYAGYNYLFSHGYTRACANMVPPYCATNDEVDDIIAKYAMTSRVKTNHYNSLPIQEPYNIGLKEVTSDTSPDIIRQWIDDAIENELWLVLVFHSVESPADVFTKYDIQDFKKITDYLYQKRSEIDVVTLSELLDTDQVLKTELAKMDIPTQPGRSGWSLAWECNFNDAQLDETDWNIINKEPFANGELQTYRTENVKVGDGCLQLVSSLENDTYYSGAVTTENKRLFLYGRIEIKAKLPSGQGIFPAFWMLPQSGDSFPEIDIIEYLGNDPNHIWHVYHYLGPQGQDRFFTSIEGKNFSGDFHIFTLQWSEECLTWMIDGVETYSVTSEIPNQKMFLYLNTAVGGDWPGNPDSSTIFPVTMIIDYIKYYTPEA